MVSKKKGELCRLCMTEVPLNLLEPALVVGPRKADPQMVCASVGMLCRKCITKAKSASLKEQGVLAEQIEANLNTLQRNRQQHWGITEKGEAYPIETPNQEEVHCWGLLRFL